MAAAAAAAVASAADDHHHLSHFDDGGIRRHDVVVVMIPLPAQGHLNQLLHLSRLISSSFPHIPVHYAAAATHIRQATLRSSADPNQATTIRFHELPAPSFPSPPPAAAPSATLCPDHLLPAFETAATHLRGPVAALLRSLAPSARRLVVVHDSLMASAVQDFAALPNAESFAFHSVSAFASHSFRLLAKGEPLPPAECGEDFPRLDSIFTPELWRFIGAQHELLKLSSGKLYNTCAAIEAEFVDLLEKDVRTPVWAIGPFNPVKKQCRGQGQGQGLCLGLAGRNKCLEWLDKQAAHSVLYVSFGTTTSMSKEQIAELAMGLERSGQSFVWVLRTADRGDVFAAGNGERRDEEEALMALPEGFEERVERRGVGMVVREWAPQVDILGHPATGGFMSHCGWNSSIESLGAGVPIAAWPMHSDQPANSVLVSRHLRVGLVVREWARRNEVVPWQDIERAVRKLMESAEGEGMRRRAAALGHAIRRSTEEGGESQVALESFVAHITKQGCSQDWMPLGVVGTKL